MDTTSTFTVVGQHKDTWYRCRDCGKKFYEQNDGVSISCTVLHAGGCCHYGEVELDA